MVLTNKEKGELNKAILDYLKTEGLTESAEILQKEAETEELDPKKTGLLEKKWTSVIRLNKKVTDLETKVKQLQEEMGTGRSTKTKSTGDNLPRPPEMFTLSGHRDNLTAVKFHPMFNLLVSASQDATMKIWDFETGEFERTFERSHECCSKS